MLCILRLLFPADRLPISPSRHESNAETNFTSELWHLKGKSSLFYQEKERPRSLLKKKNINQHIRSKASFLSSALVKLLLMPFCSNVSQAVCTRVRSADWSSTTSRASQYWLTRPCWDRGGRRRRRRRTRGGDAPCCPTLSKGSRCPQTTASACCSWTLAAKRARLWVSSIFFHYWVSLVRFQSAERHPETLIVRWAGQSPAFIQWASSLEQAILWFPITFLFTV